MIVNSQLRRHGDKNWRKISVNLDGCEFLIVKLWYGYYFQL